MAVVRYLCSLAVLAIPELVLIYGPVALISIRLATVKGVNEPADRVECLALFVPVDVRETGMRGALNGTRKEAYAGADSEPSSAG
jgi:hypothetical protein